MSDKGTRNVHKTTRRHLWPCESCAYGAETKRGLLHLAGTHAVSTLDFYELLDRKAA